MKTLVIRNIPPETHRWVKEQAAKNGRTVSQQGIVILAQGLGLQLSPRILNARSKRPPKSLRKP
jgi:plasmid stability protein